MYSTKWAVQVRDRADADSRWSGWRCFGAPARVCAGKVATPPPEIESRYHRLVEIQRGADRERAGRALRDQRQYRMAATVEWVICDAQAQAEAEAQAEARAATEAAEGPPIRGRLMPGVPA